MEKKRPLPPATGHRDKKQKTHDEDAVAPIAELTYHVRYWNQKGAGALKYDPVNVNKILRQEECARLHHLRGGHEVNVTTEVIEPPHYAGNKARKIMVVPSVGCPLELAEDHVLKRLLWAKYGFERPTVLLVHLCEVDNYKEHVDRKSVV